MTIVMEQANSRLLVRKEWIRDLPAPPLNGCALNSTLIWRRSNKQQVKLRFGQECTTSSNVHCCRAILPTIAGLTLSAKIHRKLNTRTLGKLVKYAQDGNTLDTHSDVPDGLQTEIRSEDQQRCDRKRKAREISPPSFHITNVIPGHAELPMLQASQTKSRSSISSPKPVSALDIPGYRDDAVQDYVEYLKGKVRNKKHRDEFEKAGKIVLDELLDLDQVYQENKPEFFTAREVKLAAAPSSLVS
jgi:hypothetical protein